MIFRAIFIMFLVTRISTAGAEDANQDLLYGCNAKESRVVLGPIDPEKEGELEQRGYIVENISSIDLTLYTPKDKQNNVYRSGSKTLKRQCGAFTIVVRGGFLNSNPMGELGAIEYPLIGISFNGKSIAKPIAIGECDSTNSRYNAESHCPDDWATEITVLPDTNQRASLYLKHSYEELRTQP
jgi:hypothetical protein